MSGELNNIGLITVLKADKNKAKLTMFNDGLRQKTTTIPQLAAIPIDDDDMHTLANNGISAYNALHSKPPTGTSSQLNSAELKFITGYNKNAAFIQSAARDAAILAGDVNVGIGIVSMAGYFCKSAKSPTESGFSGAVEGTGVVKSLRISTKSVAPHCIYIRKYGIVTEEGVIPAKIEEYLIGSEATIYLSDIQKQKYYAVCEAYVLPITRKASDGTPETQLEKKATLKTITSAHRRVFGSNEATHYNFGSWIWIQT